MCDTGTIKSDSETIKIRPPTPEDGELVLLRLIAANTFVIAKAIQGIKLPVWLVKR